MTIEIVLLFCLLLYATVYCSMPIILNNKCDVERHQCIMLLDLKSDNVNMSFCALVSDSFVKLLKIFNLYEKF